MTMAQNTAITFPFIGMSVDFMSAQYTTKGAKHEK
jgi:hypothetical protein